MSDNGTQVSLDEKDFQILEKLKTDSQKPVKDIAEELNLPRTTVFDRIKKMEQECVIQKYSIKVDQEKLGQGTTAFVLLTYDYKSGMGQEKVAEQLAKIPGVFETYIITGTWDMLLKVRGENLKRIGETVLDQVRATPGVAATLSCLVYRSIQEQ